MDGFTVSVSFGRCFGVFPVDAFLKNGAWLFPSAGINSRSADNFTEPIKTLCVAVQSH